MLSFEYVYVVCPQTINANKSLSFYEKETKLVFFIINENSMDFQMGIVVELVGSKGPLGTVKNY